MPAHITAYNRRLNIPDASNHHAELSGGVRRIGECGVAVFGVSVGQRNTPQECMRHRSSTATTPHPRINTNKFKAENQQSMRITDTRPLETGAQTIIYTVLDMLMLGWVSDYESEIAAVTSS